MQGLESDDSIAISSVNVVTDVIGKQRNRKVRVHNLAFEDGKKGSLFWKTLIPYQMPENNAAGQYYLVSRVKLIILKILSH